MKTLFKEYLFNKHILVHDSGTKSENAFETLFTLANLFNIKITAGQELATPDMIEMASECIGINVPEPFYRGFPQSVRELSKDQLLFDQMVHYMVTYGFGNFSEAGHSLLEENFERLAFKENCEIKEFTILCEEAAVVKLAECVEDLLKSTRPISDSQYELVKSYITTYNYEISICENKDTAIRLMLELNDTQYAQFISLADILKVVERIQYERYGSENMKKLNLRNQDRKLIKGLIDVKFTKGDAVLNTYSNAVKECFEKRAIWAGLLHHIHYVPVNEYAAQFVEAIRSGKNLSSLSSFERAMTQKNIEGAVNALLKGKGSGALLRKLNYILSRCDSKQDVEFVMSHMETDNPIILIQLLLQYASYKAVGKRSFKFTKFNRLRVHEETARECSKRKSVVSEEVRDLVVDALRENLQKIYKGRLGKVYVDPSMMKMMVPLQENTSMGGFGTLPRGSRIPIKAGEGKKIRAFTYWEKVSDIDLSCIGITEDGSQVEFSWRTMWDKQSTALTFSGDETSGYRGGSEYFDLDVRAFKKLHPEIKYVVFCNNVFSGSPFDACICRAGYMVRDIEDSGQVFEPKTVTSAFVINGHSTFAYLFGIDLDTEDFIWLNTVRESRTIVAGTTSLQFLLDYFNMDSVFSIGDLFTMLATEVVEDPAEADVVVTDEDVEVKEGAEVIRSYDNEKILAYMNV